LSLESCFIQLAVEDEELQFILLDSFEAQVEPCFEVEAVGYRTLDVFLNGDFSTEEDRNDDDYEWRGREVQVEQPDDEFEEENGEDDTGEDGREDDEREKQED